jgi:hypothetical protein
VKRKAKFHDRRETRAWHNGTGQRTGQTVSGANTEVIELGLTRTQKGVVTAAIMSDHFICLCANVYVSLFDADQGLWEACETRSMHFMIH